MKQVIIFPRGQLSAKDKKRLENNDFLVIEADNPREIIMLLPSLNPIKADDLLMSAMQALSLAMHTDKANFFDALYKRIKSANSDSEAK